jgi:Putative antitoxin of bacterial toxin-antitoxin system, YdaS/YdaT
MVLTATKTGWCNKAMDLKTFLKSLPDEDARKDFAIKCDTALGHLRNIGYGLRTCAPALAVAIERESTGQVTRRDLCPDDWQKVWPELQSA